MEEEILARLRDSIEEEVIIGEPTEVAGITFVPLINLLVGGGMKDKTVGGGGVLLRPTAVIVIKEQEISCFSLTEDSSLTEVKEQLPQVMDKIDSIN